MLLSLLVSILSLLARQYKAALIAFLVALIFFIARAVVSLLFGQDYSGDSPQAEVVGEVRYIAENSSQYR